ncbi:MAG: phasin family protein [Halieaceae bacterium]|jgi:hypothetical protein|nr:phasin family protein [Halieaceae bacterium]
MSDEKTRGDKASEMAKNIWLAGLGAYGKAFNEARDKIDNASLEPPRLFRDLVEKGMRLEDEVRDSLSSIRKTGTSTVEERIQRVRESFPLSRSEDIAALDAKLDILIARVDALAAALESATGKPAARKKAPAKKAVRRKAGTTSRKKTTAKAPAKKPAAAKKQAAPKKRAVKTRGKTSAGKRTAGSGAGSGKQPSRK